MTSQLSTTPVGAAQGEGLVAALTFDDGPNGADTIALLDLLEERGIRAVFAVVGSCIQAKGGADILRRIVADGHVLCNHSTSFADMGDWTAEQVRSDMLENLAIIRAAVPGENGLDVPVPFWRAPNGSWGVTCAVAVELGMQPLDVINHIGDWAEQDPDVLEARLWEALTRGQLLLCHDGGGDRAGTVEAVKRLIDEAVADGWEFTLPIGAS